jgi:hypothetical protein
MLTETLLSFLISACTEVPIYYYKPSKNINLVIQSL